MLAGRKPPVRQARRVYVYQHCRESKLFVRHNSHRCQGCPSNKNAARVPISKKMCMNLLTNTIVRDLEAGADLVEFICMYNASWYHGKGGGEMDDEDARHRGDRAAVPAPVVPPTPLTPHEIE
jgi:hypothetical protein